MATIQQTLKTSITDYIYASTTLISTSALDQIVETLVKKADGLDLLCALDDLEIEPHHRNKILRRVIDRLVDKANGITPTQINFVS